MTTISCSMASANAYGVPDQVEGIPDVVLNAYAQAAANTENIAPKCTGMKWSILAGVGQEESHHGTLNGSKVAANGDVSPPIIGPALNGDGFAEIPDTDDGHYDRDSTWDRAVGPMQFIPGTWEGWRVDGNGDGMADPHNIFDATATTVAYLCGHEETDLSDPQVLQARLRAYNNSQAYVDAVIGHMRGYDALPVGDPVAAAGPVTQAGHVVPCAALGNLHPYMCSTHEHLSEVFGGFALSAGGQRTEPGSDHHTGEAVDYMMAPITQEPTEQMHRQAIQVINYVIANHEQLNIKGIIYDHHIWHAAKGDPVGQWEDVRRFHQDTGDNTQDHVDHIHLAAGEGRMR
ncbi:lytic transglycosylase domain-containing protein [Nocardiopsis dassonvillei]|uniref:lytic transglycosylase domain-containing protein n=1 Tax=Nocardiopsis dassonvillei TaxID=2014 RepID=UPI0033F43343